MKFRSNKAEFDSIIDTIKKNNEKEINMHTAEMKNLTQTEEMYLSTYE